jgi:hypothetical protein
METDKDSLSPVLVFIFFSILYYLVRANIQEAGFYEIRQPAVEIFVIAFLIVSGQTIMWISRYFMPHVAVNGFSGSILGRPTYISQKYKSKDKDNQEKTLDYTYAVFNTGESLEPFHIKGKLATLIVPSVALKRAGQNYLASTFVKKFPVKFLPPDVYNYLIHHENDYNLENIYFGNFDEEFASENPDVTNFQDLLDASHSQTNFLRNILEGRNDDIKEVYELGKTLAGNDDKWYQKLVRRSKTADEE